MVGMVLTDIATEFLTDSDEGAVDIARSLSHASGRCQRNKRDDQEVFDQALAAFISVEFDQQTMHAPPS